VGLVQAGDPSQRGWARSTPTERLYLTKGAATAMLNATAAANTPSETENSEPAGFTIRSAASIPPDQPATRSATAPTTDRTPAGPSETE